MHAKLGRVEAEIRSEAKVEAGINPLLFPGIIGLVYGHAFPYVFILITHDLLFDRIEIHFCGDDRTVLNILWTVIVGPPVPVWV